MRKLSAQQETEIIALYATGNYFIKDLASMFNVSPFVIGTTIHPERRAKIAEAVRKYREKYPDRVKAYERMHRLTEKYHSCQQKYRSKPETKEHYRETSRKYYASNREFVLQKAKQKRMEKGCIPRVSKKPKAPRQYQSETVPKRCGRPRLTEAEKLSRKENKLENQRQDAKDYKLTRVLNWLNEPPKDLLK